MKLISWNVNGLRACITKGFLDFLEAENPDIICLQEIKMTKEQATFTFDSYHDFWNSADKKGYSGTLILSKEKPISTSYGVGIPDHDTEGRVITAEYEDFFLVNVYTPNSKDGLARLPYRMEWEDMFKSYLKDLEKVKPVIVCGDLNVAHTEIDLKNPKTNRKNAGFSDEEREKFSALLEAGFIDTFRYFNPTLEGAYSWWSYRFNARKNNAGWRIDYFLTSKSLESRLDNATILSDILGSDHCPVSLILKEKN